MLRSHIIASHDAKLSSYDAKLKLYMDELQEIERREYELA